MSHKSFADLGVSKPVVDALAARGYKQAFAVQELVIEDVLDGVDVLVKSPTGSGKTLAFGVPMIDVIEAGGLPSALVLAPTRELASQIVEELRAIAKARSVNVVAVYGGVGISPQIKACKTADVIVATPGRLIDLLDRRAVRLDAVEMLVLDEADRMLDMGFKPAVDRIVKETPDKRQTLLFSATLEGEVAKVAKAYTVDPVRHEHKPRPELTGKTEHRFLKLGSDARPDTLITLLSGDDHDRTLVFVRTKRGADRLAKRLSKESVAAVAMHGDKSQGQRERALASFESGKIKTLIATDVAARGIDVAGITHVVNFDLPGATEDYVHRVGRTARAGKDGVGITFVMPEQERDAAKIGINLGLQAELQVAGLISGPDSGPGRNPTTRPGRRRNRNGGNGGGGGSNGHGGGGNRNGGGQRNGGGNRNRSASGQR
ncbi:MAG: ATP-dependent helicase RhlE [Solirubrobacteraceae bacterium]|jgi:superfamily II DNA/RNA helicase|nr:ATP-dependent helicase RhlE [Solirubrobacteraceae bacterium]